LFNREKKGGEQREPRGRKKKGNVLVASEGKKRGIHILARFIYKKVWRGSARPMETREKKRRKDLTGCSGERKEKRSSSFPVEKKNVSGVIASWERAAGSRNVGGEVEMSLEEKKAKETWHNM